MSFGFTSFCFAQGCLWSVCHLCLQTTVKKGVPCGANDSLQGKDDSFFTAGYICGKADQSVGDLTSVVTTGVQNPAVPGHKIWAGAKLERGHLQKGATSLLFSVILRFLLCVEDKWWILMGGRLWDTNFTLKAKLYFFLFITAELWLSRAPAPPRHWTCAQQRPKAALNPSMANETQPVGNERNFIHLWSIKLM